MKKTATEQMDASQVFCPNGDGLARGQVGQNTIVIHSRTPGRYRCKVCGKTFRARAGTMFEGLRKPAELSVLVVTLLAYGCPIQAIVHAYALDERTVAHWRDRAGAHCQQVHAGIIEQGKLDLMHVQADAHPSERMQNDCLDGAGHDGLDALVAGWGGAALA